MSETHQRAVRLLRAGHRQESIRLLTEALREQESSEVWNDWATALNLWVSSEAERGYRRALELDPKRGLAMSLLGQLQSDRGKIDEAEKTFRQLSALPDKEYKPAHAIFVFSHGNRE